MTTDAHMTSQAPFPTPQPVETPPDSVPDHTVTQDGDNPWFNPTTGTVTTEPPATENKAPKLGTNRARTGGPRQLTKKDLDQLHQYYVNLAGVAMMLRPRAATAIAENAEQCVDAWESLAKQNDKVRQALLTMLEGGAWGLVISAHFPIILACIPDRIMESMPLFFGQGDPDSHDDSEFGSHE